MRKAYRYPDISDEIMAVRIEQAEPFPGYWNGSARRGLDLLDQKLRTMLASRDAVNGLDAGCGWGRLVPWMTKYAARVTAVDADPDRLRKARAQPATADTTLQFECRSITDIEGGRYDLILCSHVVQHVPTKMVPQILQNLARVASPNAVMVLAFSRSAVNEETYGLSYLNGGRARVDVIDRTRFDEAASRQDHSGSVPFRRIDPESLAVEATDAGWSLCWEWNYHILNHSSGSYDREQEEMINSSLSLRRESVGDIYTLWRRHA